MKNDANGMNKVFFGLGLTVVLNMNAAGRLVNVPIPAGARSLGNSVNGLRVADSSSESATGSAALSSIYMGEHLEKGPMSIRSQVADQNSDPE
jgi:hypothetical protein